MKTPPLLVLVLVASACGLLGISDNATLKVSVNDSDVMFTREGERVTLYNSLADPNGLAGIEVEVGGAGIPPRMFTAAELPTNPFDVPESGSAQVRVRVIQNGEVVAEGTAQWALASEVQWTVEVERSLYPINMGVAADATTAPNPQNCVWFGCHGVWRFELKEEATNYGGERLWLTILGFVPGQCTGSCEY